MLMKATTSPGQVTLELATSLTADMGGDFRKLVRDALARSPRELIMDCSQLTYIDSTGLGLLTLARNEAGRLGCSVSLVNVTNPHTRQVLEMVRFDQLFNMPSSQDDDRLGTSKDITRH
jgi:anti-anti-sigma factor